VADELKNGLEQTVPLPSLLGYLNFSSGKPDPRFQRNWNEAFSHVAAQGVPTPWLELVRVLGIHLQRLQQTSSAFKDISQAEAVLKLLVDFLLPAYRRHHADLLDHLTDAELFQPYFLVRMVEAILHQGGPWEETERITQGALDQLNDHVGYRPIATLESRPQQEPYPHERLRPIPLYLRDAGPAWGKYQPILRHALEILEQTPAALHEEAYFDLDRLDEWAIDPRAYDHHHPVNRRPNYVFGEWDPHQLDVKGHYRRFVSRQITLDALVHRIPAPTAPDYELRLFESSAVLAGIVLMSSCLGGRGPETHDSGVSLSVLVQRIAKLRDAFYARLLENLHGDVATYLRREAKELRQPFGGVRQHLNQFLARERALQLQERRLALFFASIGAAETSMERTARLSAPSVRFHTEILSLLTTGHLAIERGDLETAAKVIPQVEDLLERGIACGAVVDPWNILGFQAQFPLFQTAEDSVHDPRVDELLRQMDQLFHLYSRLMSEAAALGQRNLAQSLKPKMRRRASWWDKYATVEVSGIQRVHGGEAAESAEQVAAALAEWRERGEAPADLAFWRKRLQHFTSAKAFALVVDALLRKDDYQAAMGLLISWLSQADTVSLEDGEHSFHALTLRWVLAVLDAVQEKKPGVEAWPLLHKFFDHLEVNAEDYWQVPQLETDLPRRKKQGKKRDSDIFAAAYEDVTYEDTTDDGEEGSLAEVGPKLGGDYYLEEEGERITKRLRFLATLARLWQVVARQAQRLDHPEERAEAFANWLDHAEARHAQLLTLLDDLHEDPIPEPLGTYESLVEYDRRRATKERVLDAGLATSLEFGLTIRALRGALKRTDSSPEAGWMPLAIMVEQALLQSDGNRARQLLPLFIRKFAPENLLYTPLDVGGHPRDILRVRMAQVTLRHLVEALPRVGLLRETFQLLRLARDMERTRTGSGRQITEFNHLFQSALQAVVAAVTESLATGEPPAAPEKLRKLLEDLVRPFLHLWIDHSRTVRFSTLEVLQDDEDWQGLQQFIESYGREFFTAKFMTLANLRAILQRGVGTYLDYRAEEREGEEPLKLLADIDNGQITRERAIQFLECTIKTIIENYEEYKDYNTTTAQSDYGENLYRLIAYLRLKASYERHAWNFRPLLWVHEMLVRKGQEQAALLWREGFAHYTSELAKRHLEELKKLQQKHGLILRTIADTLEERYIQPLEYDALKALVEPAVSEARLRSKQTPALERLIQRIGPFAAKPTGVGLDIPDWLRGLESEVQRLREGRTAIAGHVEHLFWLPHVKLTLPEIEEQLRNWDYPMTSGGILPLPSPE
jgi:hypothetical protein